MSMLEPKNQAFFDSIPVLSPFSQLVNVQQYTPLPQDWHVVMCDIRNSTQAVEQGRYREVCLIAASSVMAVTNAIAPVPPLYVFGGDGATFITPPELLGPIERACAGTRAIAHASYGLELRIASVPVRDLRTAQADLRIARYRLSPHILQAALAGRGTILVDEWARSGEYELASPDDVAANLTGLECRWDPIASRQGKMVCLLIEATHADVEAMAKTYRAIYEHIESLADPANARPVHRSNLRLAWKLRSYLLESRAKYFGRGGFSRLKHTLLAYGLTRLFAVLWLTVFKTMGEKYKNELLENSDYRKFDGMLRMVLDLTPDQIREISDYLTSLQNSGQIHYGIHQSDTALMTCLVMDRSNGNHLHLVDGASGGYSSAARMLKESRAALNVAAVKAS